MGTLIRLAKSKTLWAGLAAIAGAIGAVVAGEMDLATASPVIVSAVLAIFVRDGIAKVGGPKM